MLATRELLRPQFLHEPERAETFGPLVADLCAKADYAPDPEQELILDNVFAIRPDGKSAAFECDLIGPRQNFKTAVLKMIELGWLFVTKQRLIIHSAHELGTTEETFRETATLIEDHPFLSRHLKSSRGERPGITSGNGRWAIELVGDRRLRYRARQATGGRGLTGNKVVLDEFFAVTPAVIGSLYPTLSAVPDPQVVSASSAGLLMSEALRDKRGRGRAGQTWNQFYLEFTDLLQPVHGKPYTGCRDPLCTHAKTAVGCRLDDEEVWASIMSALGSRVLPETIRSLRHAMPPAEFAREFMVWWEDPPVEDAAKMYGVHWGQQGVPSAVMPTPRALGVAADWDMRSASIAAVGDWGDAGAARVVFPATDDPAKGGNRPGTDWLPRVAAALALKYDIPVAVAGNGPGKVFVKPLVALLGEERVLVASMDQLKDAYADFKQGVTDRRDVFHNDAPELNDARAAAIPRLSSDRELIGRTQSQGDVSLLEAAHLALWGAGQATNYDVLQSFY